MKRSGWNKDSYVKEASKLYKEEVGKTFGLEKCVVVLHKLPKFDLMVSGTEDSSSHVVAGSEFLVDDTSDDKNYADTKTDDMMSCPRGLTGAVLEVTKRQEKRTTVNLHKAVKFLDPKGEEASKIGSRAEQKRRGS